MDEKEKERDRLKEELEKALDLLWVAHEKLSDPYEYAAAEMHLAARKIARFARKHGREFE